MKLERLIIVYLMTGNCLKYMTLYRMPPWTRWMMWSEQLLICALPSTYVLASLVMLPSAPRISPVIITL